MRKFASLIAPVAAVAALSASSAYAADLPYSPPPSNSAIYAPAPVYNWTGFYVGASAGWGWGDTTASTSSAFNIGIDGGLAGGQIGYNYQLPNNFVLGVEGDLLWSGMSGSVSPCPTVTQSLDWLGTIRGRVGYAMGDWMPYVDRRLRVRWRHADNEHWSAERRQRRTPATFLAPASSRLFHRSGRPSLSTSTSISGHDLYPFRTAVPQRRHHRQHRPRRPELQILTPDLGSFGKPRHHCRGFLLGRIRYLDTVFASA